MRGGFFMDTAKTILDGKCSVTSKIEKHLLVAFVTADLLIY